MSGYLLKDASADALVDAARNAIEGNAVIHPQLTRTFIEEVRMGDPLHPTRRRCPSASARSSSGSPTAPPRSRSRAISGSRPHTVKTHLERIFEKLGANDRAQAVAIAIRLGIVH